MASIRPYIIGAGVFALAYAGGSLYRQVMLIKNSNYAVRRVFNRGLTIRGLALTVEVEMDNKSNMKIDIFRQNFDILINGKKVGTIVDNRAVTVPKNGKAILVYDIVIDPIKAVTAGLNLKSGLGVAGIMNTTIDLKGNMMVKTSGILLSRLPITLSFRLGDFIK